LSNFAQTPSGLAIKNFPGHSNAAASNAAAFVRSTKVQIFRRYGHDADRDGGVVLGFGSHLNN